MTDARKFAQNTQEQAVAAWISHLNQLRLDEFLDAFSRQDINLADALASVDDALARIGCEIVATNRGGVKGMHGFIAEVAEVGVGNARSRILGENAAYGWVNDNGPVDLVRSGIEIQQKFVASGGRFGLGAIADHLQRYPEFVENGGKYQIPSDHFSVVKALHDMSPEEAGRTLSRSGDGPSFKDWQRVQAFFDRGSLGIDSLEPSMLDYGDVQQGAYASTLQEEKRSLHETDRRLRDDAYLDSRPTLQEGARATAAAAAIEGGTAFVLAVAGKLREGKRLRDLTEGDWREVAGETGAGAFKGGVRGASIYTLTNFTATPAAAASSIVTASFGIAEQANKFRRGAIDEREFIEGAELVSLEAAVSAMSSFAGQAIIPVPVLGAVIGNAAGTLMYRTASSYLSDREVEVIQRHLEEQRELDERLAAAHQDLLGRLDRSMAGYVDILERAFSPDVDVAVSGSIELARRVGVDTDGILDTDEKTRAYFLD